MHKLKQSQKSKVRQFIAITNTDEATAIYCMGQNDWKIELATDSYFTDPVRYFVEPKVKVDRNKIEALFNKYRDSVDEDKMLATGISRFCEDAALDPTSSTVLILAWKFKAATQCEFTRAEFVGGMSELGCDTMDKLRRKCETLDKEVQDSTSFKDFYLFTFNFAKNPGQKSLELDMAIAYWNIVLRGRFKFLDLWCSFLQVLTVYYYTGGD